MSNSVLPQELKDAGWKLGRKVVNDDEEHPLFSAHNEKLKQGTGQYKTVDEAIRAAVLLQLRSEAQKIAGQRAVTKRLKEMASREKRESGAEKSNSKFQIQDLKLSEVRIDGGTQPRDLRDEVVLEYFDAMLDGANFPPVDVFFDGKNYWLADGFHRFFAAKKLSSLKSQVSSLNATVHQGTKREAILFSLGANAAHGLPRSNEDKRRAVLVLLEDPEWKQWSDSAIAEAAHVSQPFVSSIRREIEKPAQAPKTPLRQKLERAAGGSDLKRFKSDSTKRTTRAGSQIETAQIGRQKAQSAQDARPPQAGMPALLTSGRVAIPEATVVLNLTIAPGKNQKRKLSVGASAAGAPPKFSIFTTEDLYPMPRAISGALATLAKKAKGKAQKG